MTNSREGDMTTVLRHLVENTQWGGNQGAKTETMDAMDRLTSNQYGDQADAQENQADANAKEPDISGGSRPTASRTANKR